MSSSRTRPYGSLGPGAVLGEAVLFGLLILLVTALLCVVEFVVRFFWYIIRHYFIPKKVDKDTSSQVDVEAPPNMEAPKGLTASQFYAWHRHHGIPVPPFDKSAEDERILRDAGLI